MVSRLPFAIEDLRAEIAAVSANADADVTIILDGASFGHVIRELNSHQGHYAIVMQPDCQREHRYKGVSIVNRDDLDRKHEAGQ